MASVLRLSCLAVCMVLACGWGLTHGAMAISWRTMGMALLHGLGLAGPTAVDGIVWGLRLPRVVLAVLVGAGLGISGTVVQGVFRNSLADPGLIGVSAGAGLGAVGMIVIGAVWDGLVPPALAPYGVAGAAFIGGLTATWLVYRLGRRDTASLLLAGVAVNAMAGAGIGFLTYLANDRQLRDMSFWSLGSLGGADRSQCLWVGMPVLAGMVLLWPAARALDALLLGEAEARLLGFRPERLLPWLFLLVAMMVGAAVAVSGGISFVGLIVPQLLRRWGGSSHRWLLPGSALAGAALLTAADALARTAVAPAELPIGVLTALLGGPFFLWLLWQGQRFQ